MRFRFPNKEIKRREAKRRRWWRRYFRRAAGRKYGKLRRMTAVCLFAAALYLAAAGKFSGRWIHAKKELQVEFRSAKDGGSTGSGGSLGSGGSPGSTGEQIWRITLDLKSGELVIYREECREEAEPVRADSE